ncbi:MAG: hypothetical protein KDA81_07700 [Planctomycetaceae bacterium]|nr:hypothetical protein [Planctomycetaceae bacterium]
MRTIQFRYQDPLDVIWLSVAQRLGMTVHRSADVYASWDGRGNLTIGADETLDADDCLAQMIFHEICHAVTEGPQSVALPDWGLQMDGTGQLVREFACLRIQAALTEPHGLRQMLASTTDFRSYYDRLPLDPLQPDGDPATEIALTAWNSAGNHPWMAMTQQGLRLTAEIAGLVCPLADSTSLWRTFRATSTP